MNIKTLGIALGLLLCSASQAVSFNFSQSADLTNAGIASLSDSYSSNGGGTFGSTSADSFTLSNLGSGSYDWESVEFYGISIDSGLSGGPVSNLSTFEINLFADNAGLPGTLLYTETVSLAGVTSSTFGTNSGYTVYQFSHTFSSALDLGSGGTYFLNVGATGITAANGFAWAFGTGAGGSSFSVASGGGWGPWNGQQGNLAFSVSGTVLDPVPEPATAALALLVVPAFRRRKRA